MDLPHVFDGHDALIKLNAIRRMRETSLNAMTLERSESIARLLPTEREGLEPQDYLLDGILKQYMEQAWFLLAHATFEFALKQMLIRVCQNENSKKPKRVGSEADIVYFERSIRLVARISNSDYKDTFESCVLLARVRNAIAHAAGYQEKSFSLNDYDNLLKLGVQPMASIDLAPLHAFKLEDNAVETAIRRYMKVLKRMHVQLGDPLEEEIHVGA